MATKKEKPESGPIEIQELAVEQVATFILGESPIILNRMTEKAKRELLMPKGRKTAADKAANLKHHPMEEFRAAPYRMREDKAPTLLAVPATAIKGALRDAALSVPGAKKAEIGRLTWVEGELLPLYGTPQIHMSITRSADMNKTPDVRTRCIVRNWAVPVKINFVKSLLRASAVVNLLAAAGRTIGIGDWRQGKGAGNYGQFRVCNANDPELIKVTREGRTAQEKALAEPFPYDFETEELISWFDIELKRRGAA